MTAPPAAPAPETAAETAPDTAPDTALRTAPVTAMLLAAGFGKRMRPFTGTAPKPLLEVGGRTMLDRLRGRTAPEIAISHETEILDTGGGVLNALGLLGPEPFFVLNGDTVWEDGPTPALRRLAEAWDPERMDALMLLHPTTAATGYAGDGDFFMDVEGRLERRSEAQIAPFVFTGSQILSPALFDGLAPGAFSLNRIYDRALDRERLFGIRHDGAWFHVGTPDSFERVSRLYAHVARPEAAVLPTQADLFNGG